MSSSFFRSTKRIVVVLAAAAALTACATPAPAPHASAPQIQAAAASSATPALVTMAPIPNPPEPEIVKAPHSSQTAEHAAKPAPQKQQQAGPLARDPAQAAHLRLAGLEQLNRGAISKAVLLLQKADQLDPNNALIRRDLDRATRISRAVNAKPVNAKP
jgi:uncharacterized protein involved in copper resistance